MTDVAKYVRIFNLNPDDDFVAKRTTSIKNIEEYIKKTSVIDDLLSLANTLSLISNGVQFPESTLKQNVEKALKKTSVSFVADEQDIQMSTCALIATCQYLEKGTPSDRLSIHDVLSICIWSAFSFHRNTIENPKMAELKVEIIDKVSYIFGGTPFTSRERKTVPIKIPTEISNDEENIGGKIIKFLEPTLVALRTNAYLDSEEINILWWSLNDYSQLANDYFNNLNSVQAVFFKALELSQLIKRMPGDYFNKIILKGQRSNDEFDFSQILEQLGQLITPFTDTLNKEKISKFKEVFPVFSLLTNDYQKSTNSMAKRTLEEWAGRVLMEASILNLSKFLKDEY